MRPGRAGLIAAVLVAAGCKAADPKPADKKEPAGTPAARPKGKPPAWLDESLAKLPGAGTGVPKAGSWADPKDPNFDVAREVKGVVAGRVLDPAGQPAKNVFIRIEPADPAPGEKDGAALGIWSAADGYFFTNGLKPGRAYNLSVEAKTADGRAVYGAVQTRPPQPNVTIALRDDLPPPPARPGSAPPPGGAAPSRPRAGGPPVPDLPPAGPGSGTPLPPPADLTGDNIPPMGLAPKPPAQPPADGAFAPGYGATAGGVPATVGVPPAAAGSPLPPSDPQPVIPVTRPENTAAGPANPTRPPVLNLPGPAVPPLPPPPVPALPAFPAPTPPASTGEQKKSLRPVRAGANFALVDALDRPWELATSRSGSVVLVEFLTTTCVHCEKAVPVLVDVQGRYAADGLEVIGVLCDDGPVRRRLELAEQYRRGHQLNYALYVEPGPEPGAVRDRLGVTSYPTAVLLDGEGTAVWKGHPGDKAAVEAAVRRQLGR